MKGLVAAAAAAACLLGVPAIAQAAEPPPGAAMSTNLEYVARVPDAAGITEGKFDRVRGTDVLVITGPLRLQDVRRQRSGGPAAARRVPAARAGRERLLAGRGHGARHAPQADHRRARPAAHRADRGCTGCPDNDKLAVRDPECKSGFYVISYADPANLRQVGDFVVAAVRPHGELHPGLPLHLDRRTGAARRPGLARPDPTGHAIRGRATGSSATAGRSGSPTCANPNNPKVSDEPIDLWRNDGYTDYSHDVDEDDAGHRLGQRPRRRPRLRHSGRHRDPYQNRVRRATPFDPILVAGGGVGRAPRSP